MKNKKILVISHNFPPDFTSGILRTLSFAKNLSRLGWNVNVLTSQRYNIKSNYKELKEIPEDITIERIKYFDSKDDLSIKGKYFRFTAYPDRYLTWFLFSFLFYIFNKNEKRDIDIIFSTYPAPSSHLLGYALSRLLKKPWIADFRDPMLQDDYPEDKIKRKIWQWIENRVVNNASHMIFTTESAKKIYLDKYPQLDPGRCHVIANGYIEEDFINLSESESEKKNNCIKIIHAGGLYPEGRNPYCFFKALKKLIDHGDIPVNDIQIEFYGSGDDELVNILLKSVESLGLGKVVHFFPSISHDKILQKMIDADFLLLLQGAEFDKQIPGKVYEYFKLQKSIIALTTAVGETGKLITSAQAGVIANQEDEIEIYQMLKIIFLKIKKNQCLPVIPRAELWEYSRFEQARKLAAIVSLLVKE